MVRRFHKMHGLGNDFVIFDARETPLAIDGAHARAVADRQTGIGCDQLILLEPSKVADLRMRIFNADGAGATVDMGEPRFDWDAIPLAYPMDTARMPVGWEELQNPAAVNVGNPHVILFVDDANAVDLERLGPIIEHDPLFPERINVNVASAEGDALRLRVWERGAGLTQACGTGACATAVAAISLGRAPSPVEVRLPGGTLTIAWERGGRIRMTGPAAHVFTGEIDLEALA